MKQETKLTLIFSTALMLGACSGVGGSSGGAHVTETKTTTNVKTAEEYFAQFKYRPTRDCKGKDDVRYMRYLSNPSNVDFFKLPLNMQNGMMRRGEVDLFLLENNEYIIKYSFEESLEDSLDPSTWRILSETRYEGKYKLEGEILVLENIGNLISFAYNGLDAAILHLSPDSVLPHDKDMASILVPTESINGLNPDDSGCN